MNNFKPTVLLWLRQTRDTVQVKHVHDALAAHSGVLGVLSNVRNPRLALVTYDAQRTTSQRILRAAREWDQEARLVAM